MTETEPEQPSGEEEIAGDVQESAVTPDDPDTETEDESGST